MSEQRAFVKNAADPEQVMAAVDKVKRGRERELNDLRTVLSTVQGRRVLWRLMSQCRTFNSIYEQSARIHYNAGQQDIGHFLMAEIAAASEESLFTIMKENKETDHV